MDEEASFPNWLKTLGYAALPGTLFLALDLTYERTLLTWSHGEQMVGFSISHLLGPLLLIPLVSVVAAHAFLFALLVLVIARKLQLKRAAKVNWILVATLLISISALYIPYRTWRRLTISVAGPGPRAAQTLVWAAHDGDKPTVVLLLNHGVPVDVLNVDSTALNGACAGSQLEMAKFLIAKGAEITRALECQSMLPGLRSP